MRARRWLALPFVTLIVLASACTGDPPPPVVTSPVAKTTVPKPKVPSRIVVGVEHIAGGYNPHLLADSSTITSALATLLLPSVFRPAAEGESEKRVLDTTVMSAAEVTSTEPFTVSYQIRDEASWSDGAPIAAEDFIYLAEAMKNRPGVVDPAGYRLISDIRSSDGGKHVEVEFAAPYPAWRTLFDNLLPAHLLKDAPGGWPNALSGEFPAYGGAFAIKSIDMARGEIVLQRNERYWGDPAGVDQIVLRRTEQQDMAAALRSGTIQLALASTDETGLTLFQQLGKKVRLQTLQRPRIATALLRPTSAQLSDDRVRAAVAALLDRETLIEVGTAGGSSAELHADAQVRAPSDPDYQATIPTDGVLAKQLPEKAAALLEEAGYSRVDGMWRKNGKPLTLVIATPGDREPYTRIAEAMAGQLASAGIDVRTEYAKPRPLFGGPLAIPRNEAGQDENGAGGAEAKNKAKDNDKNEGKDGPAKSRVDIAIVPQETGTDTATVLASRFGCGPAPGPKKSASGQTVRAAAAAYCDDSDLQTTIRDTLTGQQPVTDVLADIESRLWESHISIPLFQLADTLVVGKGIEGVDTGSRTATLFESAADWSRAAR